MKTIQINNAAVVKQILDVMPVATKKNKGLMNDIDFLNIGNATESMNIDEVGSCYGYSYQSDGSGGPGPFISTQPSSNIGLQIKAIFDGSYILYRVKNPVTREWSPWKRFG